MCFFIILLTDLVGKSVSKYFANCNVNFLLFVHKAKTIKRWFSQSDREELDRPTKSPGLNPMKYWNMDYEPTPYPKTSVWDLTNHRNLTVITSHHFK